MERNAKTTVYELKIGDRFYKLSDKKKTVLQKVTYKTKQTGFQTYSHGYLEASIIDHPRLHSSYKDQFIKAVKSDTEVIFLRNIND